MSERLKDEIIQTSADRLPASCDTRTTTSKRKPSLRFVKIFTAAASIILSFIMLFSLFGRNIFLRGEEFAVMQIDINPSLALTLDEDYRVKKVTSRNEDGDVLLQDKTFAESLQDKSAEEAARLIAERAAATGYIRISDKGTAEKYNKITVSLFNNRENASKEAQGIQNELVEFFNDKGVYVYIETFSEKTPEAETLTNKYDTLPTLWYDFKTESADIAALTSLAEKTVYDYAADLLKDALAKYDLLNEIGRINKKLSHCPKIPAEKFSETIGRSTKKFWGLREMRSLRRCLRSSKPCIFYTESIAGSAGLFTAAYPIKNIRRLPIITRPFSMKKIWKISENSTLRESTKILSAVSKIFPDV